MKETYQQKEVAMIRPSAVRDVEQRAHLQISRHVHLFLFGQEQFGKIQVKILPGAWPVWLRVDHCSHLSILRAQGSEAGAGRGGTSVGVHTPWVPGWSFLLPPVHPATLNYEPGTGPGSWVPACPSTTS